MQWLKTALTKVSALLQKLKTLLLSGLKIFSALGKFLPYFRNLAPSQMLIVKIVGGILVLVVVVAFFRPCKSTPTSSPARPSENKHRATIEGVEVQSDIQSDTETLDSLAKKLGGTR